MSFTFCGKMERKAERNVRQGMTFYAFYVIMMHCELFVRNKMKKY